MNIRYDFVTGRIMRSIATIASVYSVCLSVSSFIYLLVCFFVCLPAYLRNHMTKFYEIFRRLHITSDRGSVIL